MHSFLHQFLLWLAQRIQFYYDQNGLMWCILDADFKDVAAKIIFKYVTLVIHLKMNRLLILTKELWPQELNFAGLLVSSWRAEQSSTDYKKLTPMNYIFSMSETSKGKSKFGKCCLIYFWKYLCFSIYGM